MRTTLTIDDDVLAAARERARREGRTVGAVLSDLARASLTGATAPPTGDTEGFVPFPRRGPAVSSELIDRLRDEEGV
ncbi:ribbon-helix-helix domain-containing protein [soil metagenome]